ncbi:MAG: pyridoxal-phosphate dependent enzyme, partial [Pseudomonadota bacterium]|nr:pyridoxal-phosphate dependent enzyme [Pseudomonadota bacterium]
VWENATTAAAGIRVPVAVGDFLILRAVRESGGFAVSVSEEDIFEIRDNAAKRDGVLLCPEGAATLAAYELALKDGLVKKSETAILYNCATGLKYPMPKATKKLNRHDAINYEAMQ